jgi:rSAM/selenodomain-associated transferase 2
VSAPRISVIIPAFQEATQIAEVVACAREVGDEVLVVDAGSPDGTAALARAAGARVLQSPKGRGPQLDAGARAALGEVLLFLHADTRLPGTARAALEEALDVPEVEGGNFFLRFVPGSRLTRLYDVLYDVRRRWLGIYYGDSALFVRRSVYDVLGGFRPLPILEDYEFIRRLERRGRTRYVRHVEAHTSTRRFARRPLWTLFIWTAVQGLYLLGVPPQRLARLYADLR